MTEKEYIEELKKRLQDYPQSFRNDIVDSFEEHFEDGAAAGQSDAEIIAELGSIDDVMKSIDDMAEKKDMHTSSHEAYKDSDWEETLSNTLNGLGDFITTAVKDAVKATADAAREGRDRESREMEDMKKTALSGSENADTLILRADKASLQVRICGGENFEYAFEDSSNSVICHASVKESNAVLFVEGDMGNVFRRSAKLFVQIPSSITKINFDLPSGSLLVRDVNLDELAGSAVSCDLDFSGIHGEKTIVSTVSGDVSIDECRFNEIGINTKSGDICIEDSEGDLKCHSISGDITMNDSKGDLQVSSTSGDVYADGQKASAVSVSTTSGDIETKMHSHCESIYLKSVSGDVYCRPADDNFQASIQSVSGDFSNRTAHRKEKSGRGSWYVGQGTAKIECRTISGDVRLDCH
jgi:DUF4097 and DUF4098 domain-containing protein YvlB